MTKEIIQLPLLPLRGLLVFPSMVLHLDVGRDKSVTAIEKAMMGDQTILLAAQKQISLEEPESNDIYHIGTIAKVKQMLKLPNGTHRVLVEGLERAEIVRYLDQKEEINVEVKPLEEEHGEANEEEALTRSLLNLFGQYIKVSKKITQETFPTVTYIDDSGNIADIITSYFLLTNKDKNIRYLEQKEVSNVEDKPLEKEHGEANEEEALTRSLLNLFGKYIKVSKKITQETFATVSDIDESGNLADIIASHLPLKIKDK